MNKVSSILLVFVFAVSVDAQVAPKQKVRQIHLEYTSSNKSIEIKDTSFSLTGIHNTYDNPVSSIPSSSRSEERSYSLSKKEVYDLIKFIQDSKFFELENTYGAPETERSYNTRILIRMHGKEKEVVYRSNTSFESAPESFSKIETYLLKLRK